jgi:hypothetical protein
MVDEGRVKRIKARNEEGNTGKPRIEEMQEERGVGDIDLYVKLSYL